AIDVAEETHRQGDGLDELEHEFHKADEESDAARGDPVLELVQREELARVAPEPESFEPLELEVDEADQRETERDVDVARRRAQLFDPADWRDQAAPVAEQDQQKERDEEWDVRLGCRAG